MEPLLDVRRAPQLCTGVDLREARQKEFDEAEYIFPVVLDGASGQVGASYIKISLDHPVEGTAVERGSLLQSLAAFVLRTRAALPRRKVLGAEKPSSWTSRPVPLPNVIEEAAHMIDRLATSDVRIGWLRILERLEPCNNMRNSSKLGEGVNVRIVLMQELDE